MSLNFATQTARKINACQSKSKGKRCFLSFSPSLCMIESVEVKLFSQGKKSWKVSNWNNILQPLALCSVDSFYHVYNNEKWQQNKGNSICILFSSFCCHFVQQTTTTSSFQELAQVTQIWDIFSPSKSNSGEAQFSCIFSLGSSIEERNFVNWERERGRGRIYSLYNS